MAIYHLSGTIISRSQGRSAVACAAYRSGECLHDERYDVTQDYSRKQDVAHTEILAPENAPAWMKDREQLWNAVEAFENRKDSQLAREFNFALPKELTLEQNIELARSFTKTEFVDKGMVADLCIHLDKTKEGELHPHAHLMLTMREITPEGFGPKARAWNDKAQLLHWREAWSDTANHYLALNGHDIQIDHRTLEQQGIPLEPQHKLGPKLAPERAMKLADHQRIAHENGERLLANPEIALKALTQQQSTFTHQDVARFVNRHSLDASQFTAVYEAVKNHESIVHLGLDAQNRERFSTQEMLNLETRMLKQVDGLSTDKGHLVPVLSTSQALSQSRLNPEQSEALHYLMEPQSLKTVIGYAGTGKSTLLGVAREAWEDAGFRVQGLTLSGIAAETLEGSSGIETRTFASRCYYWDRNEQKLGSKDILVIDEAGMLGSRQMARVLNEVHQAGAKLVLIGDPQQLQAIEAGAAFRAISERVPCVELSTILRQREDWQRAATKEFAQGKGQEALQRYEAHDNVHSFATKAMAKEGLVELWNDVRLNNPLHTQIMLAYTREDVRGLNEEARTLRKAQGELGVDHIIHTERGQRAFAENDRIYFLRNDRSLGVMNGSLGTLETIQDKTLVVRLDARAGAHSEQSRIVRLNTEQYPYLDHGYAATIHKAQGVTVDRTYLLASRYLDNHATYVGLSRHRESVDVFWSREEFRNFAELSNTLSRERQKDVSLDYTQTFGEHRGLEVTPSQSQQTPELKIQSSFREQFEAAFPERARQLREGLPRFQENKTIQQNTGPRTLEEFKKQFESEHPERAQALDKALRSRPEKMALEVEKHFQELERNLDKNPSRETGLNALRKEAHQLYKQPEVMDYLKTHHQALSQKIVKLNQEFIKTQELNKQRELERGFER